MDAWILITFAAAGFQTLRFVMQKRLSAAALSAAGATFARFVYSSPIALLIALLYARQTGAGWPDLSAAFWVYGALGGIAQILATVCVVLLLGRRNFAVGITFKKTEVLLSVLVGLIILREGVSWGALGAMLIGTIGVLALSKPMQDTRLDQGAIALGLGSGLLFAVSGVTYRAATLEIASEDPFLRASVALAMVTIMQTFAMALWLRLRETGQISAVMGAWRRAGLIGLASLGGSLSWFTAFTLQTAGLVKAVGQIELILSILAGHLIFGERLSAREWIGIATIGLSVIALVSLTA